MSDPQKTEDEWWMTDSFLFSCGLKFNVSAERVIQHYVFVCVCVAAWDIDRL